MEGVWNFMTMKSDLKVISALFIDSFGRHGDIYWTYHMQIINESR